MLFWLILLFTSVPVLELLLLIELGKAIGTWPTVLLVLGTGVVGAALAKAQGLAVLNKIRDELATGNLPAREMFSGLCILAGGILLLTPGILTDISGLLLLFPGTQYLLVKILRRWLANKLTSCGNFYFRLGPFDRWGDDDY